MFKKAVVIAGLSAAALGVGGGVAWAASSGTVGAAVAPVAAVSSTGSASAASSTAPAPTPAPGAANAHPDHQRKHGAAGRAGERRAPWNRAAHAQWTAKDKTGAFITHDAIRGTVTAVSATSITVKAADATSQTYVVTSTTKVHRKGDAKGQAGTIAQVKVGDEVGVLGTGTSTLTATHVMDRGVPTATPKSGTPTPTR